MTPGFDPAVSAYYASDPTREDRRLREGHGRLEFLRTQELLRETLPEVPARVLDVGGGTGVHAEWLSADGYDVHLVEPVPGLAELARENAQRSPSPFTVTVGDARRLEEPDSSADAVLLLGPLYHLPELDERLAAMREAARVLRPEVLLAVSGITPWSVVMDALDQGELDAATAQRYEDTILVNGELDGSGGFTVAYLYREDVLRRELLAAGYEAVRVVPVESAAWILVSRNSTDDEVAAACRAARLLSSDPSTTSASGHIIGFATRPG